MGIISKTDRGANVNATLAPDAVAPTGGFLHMTDSYLNVSPFNNLLTGGIGIAAAPTLVPEPTVLEALLLGPGVLGLAGMTRRKLRSGA